MKGNELKSCIKKVTHFCLFVLYFLVDFSDFSGKKLNKTFEKLLLLITNSPDNPYKLLHPKKIQEHQENIPNISTTIVVKPISSNLLINTDYL